MTTKRTRCTFPDDFENQALNLANQLSALWSIPLIECLYDDGRSIKQMQNLKSVFDILIEAEQFTDALQLFILLYQKELGEHPFALYLLNNSPALIPFFLFEFLEDFDSLLEEFKLEETQDGGYDFE